MSAGDGPVQFPWWTLSTLQVQAKAKHLDSLVALWLGTSTEAQYPPVTPGGAESLIDTMLARHD